MFRALPFHKLDDGTRVDGEDAPILLLALQQAKITDCWGIHCRSGRPDRNSVEHGQTGKVCKPSAAWLAANCLAKGEYSGKDSARVGRGADCCVSTAAAKTRRRFRAGCSAGWRAACKHRFAVRARRFRETLAHLCRRKRANQLVCTAGSASAPQAQRNLSCYLAPSMLSF